MVHHLWRVGRLEDRLSLANLGVAAAKTLGDAAWEAWLLVDGLGYVHLTRRAFPEADEVIRRGSECARAGGIRDADALAAAYLAALCAEAGGEDEAERTLRRAQGMTGSPAVLGRVEWIRALIRLKQRNWTGVEESVRRCVEHRRQSDGYGPPTQLSLLSLALAQNGSVDEGAAILKELAREGANTLEGSAYVDWSRALAQASQKEYKSAVQLASGALLAMRRLRLPHQVEQLEELVRQLSVSV
jgi:LuxR family glucitol operon transcriptional activator